jgi:hypothetical protein
MISSTNDLSMHLLGNRQHEEDDEHAPDSDEEEGCMPCSLKILSEEELEDSQSSSDNGHSIFLLLVLHFLLFEAFGVALYACPVWSKINCNIILFVIITSIYKKAIKDCKPSCSAVLFLPELLQIVILSLMIFDKVVAAFLLLIISNLCLVVLMAASSMRSFFVMSTLINRKMDEPLSGMPHTNETKVNAAGEAMGRPISEKASETRVGYFVISFKSCT